MNSGSYTGTVRLERGQERVERPVALAFVRLDELDYLVACGLVSRRRSSARWLDLRLPGSSGPAPAPRSFESKLREICSTAAGREPEGPLAVLTPLGVEARERTPVRWIYALRRDGVAIDLLWQDWSTGEGGLRLVTPSRGSEPDARIEISCPGPDCTLSLDLERRPLDDEDLDAAAPPLATGLARALEAWSGAAGRAQREPDSSASRRSASSGSRPSQMAK